MNKRVRQSLLLLLVATLALHTPVAVAEQCSRGVVGSRQVVIINNSCKAVGFEFGNGWAWQSHWLNVGGDVSLSDVTLIRVAGTIYRLTFKNRYEMRCNAQNRQVYVVRLVLRK